MVRVFVIGRILVEINARQSGENEWASVGTEFDFIIHTQISKRSERAGKFLNSRNKVEAAAKLKAHDRSLAIIENYGGNMIGHLVFVQLSVSDGAEQSFFFAGEENETDGAARLETGLQNGFRSAECSRGAHAIVGGAGGEIPGIEVASDDDNLFRVF